VTFAERLERLLDGRRRTPWGLALGLNKGTLDRMRKGHIPNLEILVPVCRAENARLMWLLEGTGSPYSVSRSSADTATRELLEQQYADGDWRADLAAGAERAAVVLSQPSRYRIKTGRSIEFLRVEVIAGPVGPRTVEFLRSLIARGRDVRLHRVSDRWLGELFAGELGSYALFRRADAPLSEGRRLTPQALDELLPPEIWNVREPELSPSEREFLALYREIQDQDDRQYALETVRAFAHKSRRGPPRAQ